MKPFQYTRPTDMAVAIRTQAKDRNVFFLAGGTNLVDLMKMGVVNPEKLIDINRLPLREIVADVKGLRIGALATNSQTADHPDVLKNYPLLSQAIEAGASPQLRNMATTGGNLLQRTRCSYFFDLTTPCNKRNPGSGCSAINGVNRMHAIFGASDHCIAVNPSDMSVALRALDATILTKGPAGERRIAMEDFHRLPGDQPELDNTLQKGELITGVELPPSSFSRHTHYLKVRDRSSYAFALVSVAAALDLDNSKTIRDVRLAMGGVAHKPWRLSASELFLKGKTASDDNFRQAAEIAMHDAKAYTYNQFKIKLGSNVILQCLKTAVKDV